MPETVVQYLVELEVYDPDAGGPGIGGVRTLRYSTGLGHVTGPAETPPNAFYDPIVRQALHIKRTMFDYRKTTGRATVATGTIDLANGNGALDGVADYGVDGRAITVRRGAVGAAYPAGFPSEFVGTMEPPEFAPDVVRVKLRDRLLEMNVPLQTTKYSGAGLGTVEGTPDTLGGKPKPVCYGVVKNITPPMVESAKLILQVNDGPISSVSKVYDRGIPLTAVVDNWEFVSLAALSTGAPAATMYGNGRLVVVFNDTTDNIHTSDDEGDSWTNRGTGPAGQSNIIDGWFANGLFVVVGGSNPGGYVITSADGITWTKRTTGLTGSKFVQGVAYGNGLWVIVYGSGELLTSPDAITWTTRTSPFGAGALSINHVLFGQGKFVACGGGATTNTIAWSVDGITWTAADTDEFDGVAGGLDRIIFNDTHDLWVIVDGAATYLSLNGREWKRHAQDFGMTSRSLFYNYGKFVMGAGTAAPGKVFVSEDAVSWLVFDSGNPDADVNTQYQHGIDVNARFFLFGFNNPPVEPFMVRSPAAKVYATQADLEDDLLAPVPGGYGYHAASGLVRLGSRPAGLITADVIQGATAADRTVAQIFKTILADRAGLSVGEWSATDITDLDALNNDVIGFWTDAETQIAAVLDLVAGSIGAGWYVDAAGVFRITQLLAPSGTPVHEFTANDIRGKLQLVTPNDPGGGIPTYQTIVRYARNYTAQPEVAPAVKEDRRAFVAKEWREATDTDATVQTKHLLARQWVENSLLADEADAQTEATRRQALRGVARKMFEFSSALDDDTKAIDINHVIKLTHERHGLSAGVLFRVLGVGRNAAAGEVSFTVWG